MCRLIALGKRIGLLQAGNVGIIRPCNRERGVEVSRDVQDEHETRVFHHYNAVEWKVIDICVRF